MGKLQAFRQMFVTHHPARLTDARECELGYVMAEGEYIVITQRVLDVAQATQLKDWLKDLLEEPTP